MEGRCWREFPEAGLQAPSSDCRGREPGRRFPTGAAPCNTDDCFYCTSMVTVLAFWPAAVSTTFTIPAPARLRGSRTLTWSRP